MSIQTGIQAKVIADSISESGNRITTMQLKYPRFIHSEFLTHRVFSRNSSSSRAIPTKKLLEQIRIDPALPIHWGRNRKGMQAKEEMRGPSRKTAIWLWCMASKCAAFLAGNLAAIGTHKQIVNRIIEPFLHIHVVVTSTEWDNFFELRAHEDAQPEIYDLAIHMREALNNSTPKLLHNNEWHLPYLTEEEIGKYDTDQLCKISAARCCRVSYLNHTGVTPSVEEDLALFDRLAGAVPRHLSPLEHQACPIEADPKLCSHVDAYGNKFSGNLKNWLQYRNYFLYKADNCSPPWWFN